MVLVWVCGLLQILQQHQQGYAHQSHGGAGVIAAGELERPCSLEMFAPAQTHLRSNRKALPSESTQPTRVRCQGFTNSHRWRSLTQQQSP